MKGIITGKVKYYPQTQEIIDELGDPLCTVKRFTVNSRQQHETLARFIVEAINEKIERETKTIPAIRGELQKIIKTLKQ